MNLLMYNDQVNKAPVDDNDYEIYDVDKMYEYYENEAEDKEISIFNAAYKYFSEKYIEKIRWDDYEKFAKSNFS